MPIGRPTSNLTLIFLVPIVLAAAAASVPILLSEIAIGLLVDGLILGTGAVYALCAGPQDPKALPEARIYRERRKTDE